jgi:hypothetical protein
VSLVAVLAEQFEAAAGREDGKISQVKKVAFSLIKPALRIGLAAATAGASEVLGVIGDAVADTVAKEATGGVEAFWVRETGRRAAMQEFRDAIDAMTLDEGNPDGRRPLVFIVDELDRCRPDYALEVLEVIKHFFAVDRVHFVLGVNMRALESMVRARYGGEIDATAYLQKFISFSLSLPNDIGDHAATPATIKYVQHLAAAFGTPDHLLSISLTYVKNLNQSGSDARSVSLRDVGKLLSLISILPSKALDPQMLEGWQTIIVGMVILKIVDSSLYQEVLNGAASIDSVLHRFCLPNAAVLKRAAASKGAERIDNDTRLAAISWFLAIDQTKIGEFEESPDWGRNLIGLFSSFHDPEYLRDIPLKVNKDFLSQIGGAAAA